MITSEEMFALDTNCRYYGLTTLQLMENAGKAIAEEIRKRIREGNVAVFAGTGNNAGDAFVAARHLKEFDVKIYLMREDFRTEETKTNFEILKKAGYEAKTFHEWIDEEIECDVVLDGLLGTGVKGKLRKDYREAIEKMNEIKAFKVAIDVPSGLNPDTGEFDVALKANLTVTFHKPKPGLYKAKEICGEIVVADIGIPEYFEKLTGPGDVKISYKRDPNAHKGQHGRVLVVGGSPYIGAPVLTALAAYAAGADIVTLLVPESIYEIAASFSPEIITRKLRGEEITENNIPEILEFAEKHDVVVFGMGTVDKGEIATEISKKVKKIVLDAGGLTSKVFCEAILTPHAGEFKRVFGKEATVENVKEAAKSSRAVLLLKGRRDVITDGEKIKFNLTGNEGMTVGGTGDVLAGVCGAFFAKNSAFKAACSSAFTVGLAGDFAMREKSFNFTAKDVIEMIPRAIKFSLEF